MKEYNWKEEVLAEIDARMYCKPTNYEKVVQKYEAIQAGTDPDFTLYKDLMGGEDWMTDDEKDAFS